MTGALGAALIAYIEVRSILEAGGRKFAIKANPYRTLTLEAYSLAKRLEYL